MALGPRIRELRVRHGLTQTELAQQAEVSRQMVGAVEAGRHLPRVDAAAALARVLGTTVEALMAPPEEADAPVGVLAAPADGALVRIARVGDRRVVAPAEVTDDGLPAADGRVQDGRIELFEPERPAAVIVGCEPAVPMAARLLEARSAARAVSVAGSSADAHEALRAGRAHAAVVHGRADELPNPGCVVHRVRIAAWRVGLAAPRDLPAGWAREALAGRRTVIQRDAGAQSQAAFARARAAAGHGDTQVAGPRVAGHLAAARRGQELGAVAVTIEPSALLTGLAFHPLEIHVSELWIAAPHAHLPDVARFLEVLTDTCVSRRLEAIGGYDLSEHGRQVAA